MTLINQDIKSARKNWAYFKKGKIFREIFRNEFIWFCTQNLTVYTLFGKNGTQIWAASIGEKFIFAFGWTDNSSDPVQAENYETVFDTITGWLAEITSQVTLPWNMVCNDTGPLSFLLILDGSL